MAALSNVVDIKGRSRVQSAAKTRGEWQEYSFRNTEELGDFVGKEIRASKMKYNKLAEKSGLCTNTISRLAHGETTYPRAHTLLMVLKALGFEFFVRG